MSRKMTKKQFAAINLAVAAYQTQLQDAEQMGLSWADLVTEDDLIEAFQIIAGEHGSD